MPDEILPGWQLSQITQAFSETGCRSKARGHELGPHCPPGDVQSTHVHFGALPPTIGLSLVSLETRLLVGRSEMHFGEDSEGGLWLCRCGGPSPRLRPPGAPGPPCAPVLVHWLRWHLLSLDWKLQEGRGPSVEFLIVTPGPATAPAAGRTRGTMVGR